MTINEIQENLNEDEQPDYIKNQIRELDRRLERLENGETTFLTWEEIQKELAAKWPRKLHPPPQHPNRHLLLPQQKNNHKGLHSKEVLL